MEVSVLEIELERCPEPTGPVYTGRECHRRSDTHTRSSRAHEARKREERRDEHGDGTEAIEIQEQPAVRHPEAVPHLCSASIRRLVECSGEE